MTNPKKPTKPKRNYTVTERVLAACRINVGKARKAALERRFCATRGTWPEMQAAHANLELAQRVKREDNTYKYCSAFRHGLSVADLERSLVMAGESREEYLAHLGRFAALPGVFDFDAASQEVKLARACAFTSWRRLRALRLQSEWALRMMVHHLHATIGERNAPSAEGQTSLTGFGKTFGSPVISSAAAPVAPLLGATRDLGAARNLALKSEAMRDSSPPSAPPFDFAQGGQSLNLTAEGFVQLAIALEGAADSWPSLWGPIRKLNNRFDQLWCTLVQELGEPEPFLVPLSHTERAAMRLSPIVANFQAHTAEMLGNPLIRTKRLLELLKTRAVYVKPVEEWACSRIPYQIEDRMSAEVRRSRVYLQSLENKQVTLMGNLDYHLLRAARKPPQKSGAQQDPSLAVELPKTFEEFLALVEAAFGETADSGFGRDAEDDSEGPSLGPRLRGGDGSGIWDPSSNDVVPAKAGIHDSPIPSGTRKPTTPPTIRDLAQLLWDTAMLTRLRAEQEARLLAEYLTEYAARLASSDPKDEERRQHLANQILKLFRQAEDQKQESVSLNRRVHLALHDAAVARYGKQPEFECLINGNYRSEELYSKFYKMYWAEVHRILGRRGGVEETEEEGKEQAKGKRQKQTG